MSDYEEDPTRPTESQIQIGLEGRAEEMDHQEQWPWYAVHDNLILLADYMASYGYSADDLAEMIRKPWQWADEYDAAVRDSQSEPVMPS